MHTDFTIKNFRVFDGNGATVNINPLTILTGCNSSGKSSIVKAMVLFNTYLNSVIDEYKRSGTIRLDNQKLDFTQEVTTSLGSFIQIINNNSNTNKVTFEYIVHSVFYGGDLFVSFVFQTDEDDDLKSGYLSEFYIKTLDNGVIYSSTKECICKTDYNLIIPNFFRFVKGQYIVNKHRLLESAIQYTYGSLSDDEYVESIKKHPESFRKEMVNRRNALLLFHQEVNDLLNKYNASFGEDAICDIIEWANENKIDYYTLVDDEKEINNLILVEKYCKDHPEVIENSSKNKTLFYSQLFESLKNCNKSSFKAKLLSILNGNAIAPELEYAINKINDDFTNSNSSTFGDYFSQKEVDFLNFTFDNNSFKKYAPSCNVGSGMLFNLSGQGIGSYLDTTRRMMGPAYDDDGPLYHFSEYEDWKNWKIDFETIYNVLMEIDKQLSLTDDFYYNLENRDRQYSEFRHVVFDMFKEYVSLLIQNIITRALPNKLHYIPSSLIQIKKIYPLEIKDDFTNLLKKYFEVKRTYLKEKWKGVSFNPGEFIDKWVNIFEVGHSISINVDSEGLGVTLRLHKDKNDIIGSLLSNQGYGITQLFVILLRIEIAIMESREITKNVDKYDLRLPDRYRKDGQITQSLSGSTIAIEEPEVHLHPKFQSKLAELFADAYKKYNINFIIETHSEYLIRKLQTLVANKVVDNNDTSILYVYGQNDRPNYEPPVKRIYVKEDGMLDGHFGEGFFDEADSLSLELLSIG